MWKMKRFAELEEASPCDSWQLASVDEEREDARMFLLTLAIKASLVLRSRAAAMHELRRLAKAAVLRRRHGSVRISHAWREAVRRLEHRGHAALEAASHRHKAAAAAVAVARGWLLRRRLPKAMRRYEDFLVRCLLRCWQDAEVPLGQRAGIWSYLFSGHQPVFARLAAARHEVVALASQGDSHAACMPGLARKNAAERKYLYTQLKAKADLSRYYAAFGIEGKRRKRRLIAALFSTPDLAPQSRDLLDSALPKRQFHLSSSVSSDVMFFAADTDTRPIRRRRPVPPWLDADKLSLATWLADVRDRPSSVRSRSSSASSSQRGRRAVAPPPPLGAKSADEYVDDNVNGNPRRLLSY